ncbi:peptide ABC transporter substrate-binding protein [Thioclava sp. JE_KL1]|uniref:peptide ABC transporter substrate-binding protein n=1 Tax=Thioclava sp. JE_KL1 TaxID=2651187 RepID=UPI0027BB1D1A|nr:peptide ABC transporter substrate-binding protein [Thioclava sp. JE_KL1]
MKSIAAISAFALMLGSAAPVLAQSSKVPEGTKLAADQTFTYWMQDDLKTLDPDLSTSKDGNDVLQQMFEGLYQQDDHGKLVPALATSYEVSDDKKTYTFHLRNEKWSNGDPVTAQDFVYAWRRLADPATASQYSWYIELMQVKNAHDVIAGDKKPSELGVKALDDHTLQVTLDSAIPYFRQMLVLSSTFPVPQKVVEEYGSDWTKPENMVVNGPYKLKSWKIGNSIELTKNDAYYDAANVTLTDLKFIPMQDNDQALTRYEAGELDFVQTPAGQYPRLKKEYPDAAHAPPRSCVYAYRFNVGPNGPEALKDVKVRKALSYAINRDIIVDKILKGGQKPAYTWTHWATANFKAPDVAYADMTQQERMDKAKELLKEAGYGPDHPLNLRIMYNTSADHKKIAIAVQQFWKQLGVKSTLENYEWKVYLDKLNGQHDFDVARTAWCADYNEASTYLDVNTSWSDQNSGQWKNADYDKLMKDSKTAADPQEDYTKAEKILAEDMPLAPIYAYSLPMLLNPQIKGYPFDNVQLNWYAKNMYKVAK